MKPAINRIVSLSVSVMLAMSLNPAAALAAPAAPAAESAATPAAPAAEPAATQVPATQTPAASAKSPALTKAQRALAQEIASDVEVSSEANEELQIVDEESGMVTEAVTADQLQAIDQTTKPRAAAADKAAAKAPSSYVAPYTSVKDQGVFGTCWSFGTIGAAESNYLMQHGYESGLVDEDPIDWSELQLVYATYNNPDGESSDSDYGTPRDSEYGMQSGGYSFDGPSALAKGSGVTNEADAPYPNSSSELHQSIQAARKVRNQSRLSLEESNALPDLYPIVFDEESKTYKHVDRSGYASIWKQAIRESGALMVSYYSDSDPSHYQAGHFGDESSYCYCGAPNYWQYDAMLYDETPTPRISNHLVTLVGYDDEYSRFNFAVELYKDADQTQAREYSGEVARVVAVYSEPEYDESGHLTNDPTAVVEDVDPTLYIVPKKDGCWIVKNSWGTSADDVKVLDDGIMYASYLDVTFECALTVEMESLDYDAKGSSHQYSTTFQHDGMAPRLLYATDDALLGANVFTAEEATDVSCIAYASLTAGTEAHFDVYADLADPSDPTSGTLVASVDDAQPYSGYHRIKLPKAFLARPGTSFSVVASMKSAAAKVYADVNELSGFDGEKYGERSFLPMELPAQTNSVCFYSKGDTMLSTDGATWIDVADYNAIAPSWYGEIGNMSVKLLGDEAELTDLSAAKVTVDAAGCTYTESAIEPAVTVELGESTLSEQRDYEVAYFDNVNAGTATVRVSGLGYYKGEAEQTFVIAKARPDMSGVKLANGSVAFDGQVHGLKLTGELPAGVSVKYYGNGVSSVGQHMVTAAFSVDDPVNWAAPDDMTATLTIKSAPTKPESADKPAASPSASRVTKWTASAKSAKVKAPAVAKRAKTIVGLIKVKGATGKLTCSKASGSKRLKVSKTGKVTVKRGTRAGTYTMKVKVKCAGAKGSKTVIVKVRVK